MSDLTLSRRAVACPGWRWLPGVRWRLDPAKCGPGGHDLGRKFGRVDELWRAVDDTGRVLISHDNILPDLTDPCTLGALLALYDERRTIKTCPDPVYTAAAVYGLMSRETVVALVAALEAP